MLPTAPAPAGETGIELEIDEVSYAVDVITVLTQAGCNAGGCHANPNGKGGFHLSLWGEDPVGDYEALMARSRTNLDDPTLSGILMKPTLEADHEGGLRFERESEHYEILRRWIEAGAPNDLDTAPTVERLEVSPTEVVMELPQNEVEISVTAHFSDGHARDVTRWATYEPTTHAVEIERPGLVTGVDPNETVVMVRYLDQRVPVRLAFVPERQQVALEDTNGSMIDRHIGNKLVHLGLPPSPVADDATFIRRVSLDLTGVPPPGERVRAFLDDQRPDKREQLVDELLASAEHAEYWGLLWADLLRVEETALDSRGVEVFTSWIRQAVKDNMPLDQFARELLAARGSTYEHAPANFWRALRNPPDRAEAVAQVFLGIRLQCAQCHNHPTDRWTQDDYYRFAGLMAGVDYEIIENNREDRHDQNRFNGEQIVQVAWNEEWPDPRTGEPPVPGMLDPSAPAPDTGADPLEELAGWIVDDNRLFARTQANRIWFRLMGRGLVEPVDDVRDTNPASHPELLEALADELEESGFDQRRMIRQIALSTAYQRVSEPLPANEWDEANYSRALVRRWSAEQIVDSLHSFLGLASRFQGYDEPVRAGQLYGAQTRYRRGSPLTDCDRYLQLFGKPVRQVSSDLERSNETSLAQVFELVSGQAMQDWLRDNDNQFDRWIEEHPDPADLLERMFLEGLSRPPGDEERAYLAPLLEDPETRRAAVEDIAWAILNSKEFILRN